MSPKELTAIEVRNALEDSSNSEDFSNSLSACHAALKRMLSDREVEAGPLRNGKATFRRVLKLEPPKVSAMEFLLNSYILANPPEPRGGETGTERKKKELKVFNPHEGELRWETHRR